MLEDIELRKRDFIRRFNEILSACPKPLPPLKALLVKTLMSKAPGYYISYDYARRLLRLYRRKMLPASYNPLRYKMISEIARRVDEIKKSNTSHAEGRALTRVLVQGNASRFFISLPTATRIINSK